MIDWVAREKTNCAQLVARDKSSAVRAELAIKGVVSLVAINAIHPVLSELLHNLLQFYVPQNERSPVTSSH